MGRRVWWALMASCLVLAACGGGGSGGSSTPGGTTTPVTPSNDIGAHMSMSSVTVERDLYRRNQVEKVELALLVDRPPAEGYYYRVTYTKKALNFIGESPRTDSGLDLQVGLSSPGVLGLGSYDDTITVEVCIDSKCATPARGSPFVVPVKLKVGHFAEPEAGQPQQVLTDAVTLPHDVVAAAYSASLDAVVSVSKAPAAALNLRSLADGQTRSVALASVPTSVALSPDGRRAAVGHDGAVSLVDLVPATPGAAMAVSRFAVSMPVGAVVLDGQGRIYAFGSAPTWAYLHWVDTANGIDKTATANIYSPVLPVLHAAGDRIYFSTRDVSPNDIYNVTLEAAGPRDAVDSPYHGDYEICGQVWTSATSSRLYTACGKVFTASSDPSLDMRYAGSFAMSASTSTASFGYAALSISDSLVSNQLVVLEQDKFNCDPRLDMLYACFTRVGTFNATDMALQARASLAPVTVGADRFAQVGRYVFHRVNGKVVLLTELRGAPDAAASIRLSSLP